MKTLAKLAFYAFICIVAIQLILPLLGLLAIAFALMMAVFILTAIFS